MLVRKRNVGVVSLKKLIGFRSTMEFDKRNVTAWRDE
jgi:hypothetical protein